MEAVVVVDVVVTPAEAEDSMDKAVMLPGRVTLEDLTMVWLDQLDWVLEDSVAVEVQDIQVAVEEDILVDQGAI
jgi:hypothetical protein